mmetsp:Transcript_8204/g.23466  ORF Transcript_8204/g.23466 Transcript_8204/m.23466 type:complete len:348 (-) Transcript_8204:639-1682(-)
MSSLSFAMADFAHNICDSASLTVCSTSKRLFSFSFLLSMHHWWRSVSPLLWSRMLAIRDLIMPMTLSKGPAASSPACAPEAAPCWSIEAASLSPPGPVAASSAGAAGASPASAAPAAALRASWTAWPRPALSMDSESSVLPSCKKLAGVAWARKSCMSRSRKSVRSIRSMSTAGTFTKSMSFARSLLTFTPASAWIAQTSLVMAKDWVSRATTLLAMEMERLVSAACFNLSARTGCCSFKAVCNLPSSCLCTLMRSMMRFSSSWKLLVATFFACKRSCRSACNFAKLALSSFAAPWDVAWVCKKDPAMVGVATVSSSTTVSCRPKRRRAETSVFNRDESSARRCVCS